MTEPAAFDDFIAPARCRPQLWRLIVGCLLMVVVTLLWAVATFGGIALALGSERALDLMQRVLAPDGPTGTLLLLSTFIGMAAAPMLAVRMLHARPAATLFGPGGRVVRDFLAALATVAVLFGISLLVWSTGFDAEANLPLGLWLQLLPLSLLLVLIQTGAEEAIFRGYLMQQIAARLRWKGAYLVFPSVLFGALHLDLATMGSTAWLVAISAGLFGLAAADLTRATGSLGAAWGLHFANNVVAILFVSTRDSITGLALYVTPYSMRDGTVTGPLILIDLAVLAAVWGLLRWWLGR